MYPFHQGHPPKAQPTFVRGSFGKNRSHLPVYRIAIIGGGPKGTYGFERLAAQLKAHPIAGPVEIHVFNRTEHFGAGDVYRPDQPDFLLINFSIGNINMWLQESDDEPRAVVPNPRPLTAWLRHKHQPPLEVSDLDYASRAQVGRYLMDGFRSIITHLPANVTSKQIVGEVVDVRPVRANYRIRVRNNKGDEYEMAEQYHKVLLATGHPRPPRVAEHARLRDFCQQNRAFSYVPFIYPVDQKLRAISAGANVAVKGLGLTFVDAVLALTEGRGGTFSRDDSTQRLIYHPSGSEPKRIYPFSRSGLPMLPRGPRFGPSSTKLCVFTEAVVDKLISSDPNEKIDFEQELWPLLRLEMTIAYYRVLFQQHDETLTVDDLSDCGTYISAQIEQFHRKYPAAERFTPEHFLDPLGQMQDDQPYEHHQFIVDYLRRAIDEAKRGETNSPWMAVVAVWREATPLFGCIYEFGGLWPDAQRLFAEQYSSSLSRITFGPPIVSMEKILAVAEAGILNFELSRAAEIRVDDQKRIFTLQSSHVDSAQTVQAVIDARIPKVSLMNESARLYRNLVRRGLVVPFENRAADSDVVYRPGCIALNEDGYVIDKLGRKNRAIAATGTPTEGITFDNDSLSRLRNNFVSQWAKQTRQEIEEYYAEYQSNQIRTLSTANAHYSPMG